MLILHAPTVNRSITLYHHILLPPKLNSFLHFTVTTSSTFLLEKQCHCGV